MRKRYDWGVIQKRYNEGLSLRDLQKEIGIGMNSLVIAQRRGDLKTRNLSNAMALATEQGKINPASISRLPQNREKAKQRMLKRISDDPSSHPNRKLANNRKRMSFPEKVVYNMLLENGIQFKHNSYISPYWPDFLFEELGLIVEIDGERWHNEKDDQERDSFLNDLGYGVKRFTAKEVIKNPSKVLEYIIGYEGESEPA